MSGHSLVVVGIGHDGPSGLSAEARAHVEAARILAGGRRHLDFFPHWRGEKVLLGGDVTAFVDTLREKYRQAKTVVLASGDPLFYGIGRALLEAIPRDDLLFLPQVSSVQLAFARIKETWHDARLISVHGRSTEALAAAVVARATKIAVLTDAQNHPAALAELLCQLGAAEEYILWVCENLGGPDERISRYSAAKLCGEQFSPLNVVILLRDVLLSVAQKSEHPMPSRVAEMQDRSGKLPLSEIATSAVVHFSAQRSVEGGQETPKSTFPLLGIPEEALLLQAGNECSQALGSGYGTRSVPTTLPRGMITRREVRLLALCYLELRPGDVLWDVGAGTGSVSLEAARLSPQLDIFAIERDATAFARLEINVAQFGMGCVHTLCAEAPDGLAGLPDPDAVFIGGSGGKLAAILGTVRTRLRSGGRVVVNCITLENFCRGWETLRELNFEPEATSVQLAHSRPLGRLHSLEPDNPIFILRARKS